MDTHTRNLIKLLAAGLLGFTLLTLGMLWASTGARAGGLLYAAPTPSGSADCSAWANACTLQTALASAVSGDQIWVRMGVHKPTSTTDRTISFALQPGVEVYGGFAGTEDDLSERDWQANLTVLSGDIDGNDLADPTGVVTDTANINGANSYHVVSAGGTVAETARLDGFAVTAGQADGSDYPHYMGGGMINDASSPTLENMTFSANQAGGAGSGCGGGGIYNYASDLTLRNVTFSANQVSGTGVTCGGGGMYNYVSNPILEKVTFSANQVSGTGWWTGGAGMYNDVSNPILENVIFSGNQAAGTGSGSGGGAIYNMYSHPKLVNVTLAGNYGWPGAALYNMGSAGAGSNPTLTNVIVWGNSPESGQIWNEGSSTPAVNYSLVQGGYTGVGNLDADPHFVAPLDGSLAPTAAGNYRLLLNSPAIDAGDNSAVTPGVTSDLDGNPRFVDILSVADTGSGTSPIVDLGSYEAFIGVHFAAPAAVGSGDCSAWANACTLADRPGLRS